MKKYDKILIDSQKNPLLQMTEMGITPNEIKQTIINSFDPYFENKEVLEKDAINLLVVDFINLLKLQNDTFYFDCFEKCLLTFNAAKIKNSHACFESCANWQCEIEKSLSQYWSTYLVEIPKNTLETEEYVYECLRNIGSIIEGVIKPYLKILIHFVRIENGRQTTVESINSTNLGAIVKELIDTSNCSNLLVLNPNKIKLNQWRNIAYHHSTKIENNQIICSYGKSSNLQHVHLTKEELLQVVRDIAAIYRALSLAHTIFFIDNGDEILKHSPSAKVRDEAGYLKLIVGLNSQGFEIINFERDNEAAKLVIKDVQEMPIIQRTAHASQFILQLWIITRSNQLNIEYRDNHNTPCFYLSSNSEICEKVYKGELDNLVIPKTMTMTDLRKK